MSRVVRLARHDGLDRFAVVSFAPSSDASDAWLVRIGFGDVFHSTTRGTVRGPFSASLADEAFDAAVRELETSGYTVVAAPSLVEALASDSPRARALAAKRVAASRDASLVPALLAAAGRNATDLPLLVEALGRTRDSRAAPLARSLAEKKLLSRRRSGVEALRCLGDEEALAAARVRAIARLPDSITPLVAGDAETIAVALRALPLLRRGEALDTLYELADPHVVDAVRRVLADSPVHVPHLLRYTKSIWKRAMLRDDVVTFGLLARRFEQAAWASSGERAEVKHGLDGARKTMRVFGKRTSTYVRRASIRHLRRVAHHDPAKLAAYVANVLVHYREADARLPRGAFGAWSHAYPLCRIVYGGSRAVTFESRRLRMSMPTDGSPLVPAPGLSLDLLRGDRDAIALLVRDAEAWPVLDLVVHLVDDVIERLDGASLAALAKRVGGAHPRLAYLSEVAVVRRFDGEAPDADALVVLLSAASERAHRQGERLLGESVDALATRPFELARLFAIPEARASMASFLARTFQDGRNDRRASMAASLYAVAGVPDPDVATFAAEQLVSVFADRVPDLIDRDDAIAAITSGSHARALLGCARLEGEDIFDRLDLVRVLELASSTSPSLRAHAVALVVRTDRASVAAGEALVQLAESPFKDVVRAALACLEATVDLSPALVVRLVDSTSLDVRIVGLVMLRARITPERANAFIPLLAEHPSTDVRAYAVELVVAHLRDGFVPLLGIEPLVLATLREVRPDARAKRRLFGFLERRATADERQAELIARWIGDYARTRTVRDAERILPVLARIHAAYPSVDSKLGVNR